MRIKLSDSSLDIPLRRSVIWPLIADDEDCTRVNVEEEDDTENGGQDDAEWVGMKLPIMPDVQSIAERLNWWQTKGRREFHGGGNVTYFEVLQQLIDRWIASGRERAEDGTLWQQPTLFQVLTEYLSDNPAKVILGMDGRLEMELPQPKLYPKREAVRQAQEEAAFTVVRFLNSPTKYKISRCDHCKDYFMKKRVPRSGTVNKRGAFCSNPKCRTRGSVNRTNASRDVRMDKLVSTAAMFWPHFKATKLRPNRSKWVADKVNQALRLKEEKRKTGNWVTRHENDIENALAQATPKLPTIALDSFTSEST